MAIPGIVADFCFFAPSAKCSCHSSRSGSIEKMEIIKMQFGLLQKISMSTCTISQWQEKQQIPLLF